ncbi:MAG: hypothetical protein CFE37_13345 [Alphaproteobacteria bacterium PA4]|nr:MAG: hypothetical protein CFE37_13345 [Alphaproteobacteria bacterium PA4]
MRLWRRDRGARAESARRLAARWARSVGGAAAAAADGDAVGQVLALAWPDRVARRRGGGGASWLMANGRAVTLDAADPLAKSPWLVIADAAGSAAGARVLSAAAIDESSVLQRLATSITETPVLAFDPETGGVVAETQRRLGAIMLGRRPVDRLDPALLAGVLLQGVRDHGLQLLPWGDASHGLRQRSAFVRAAGFTDIADPGDAALRDTLDDWLAPLLAGKRRLGDIGDAALAEALAARIGWAGMRRLDALAPVQFTSPAGSNHRIDYAAEGGPAVDVRVQALFGLAQHPMLADGRQPLTLRLTSPAGRPIQVTRDLPRFWTGSWADVRRDLRGRYPKHPWPEDPRAAPPTLRARRPGQPG